MPIMVLIICVICVIRILPAKMSDKLPTLARLIDVKCKSKCRINRTFSFTTLAIRFTNASFPF